MARTGCMLSLVSALMAAVVLAGVSSADGAPAPAQIISYLAVPREIGPSGGLVVIQADVRNALACRLKLLSRQSFAVVYSHAPSYACESGYFSPHVQVGANASSMRRTVTFEVIVTNATSRAVALVRVGIAARA